MGKPVESAETSRYLSPLLIPSGSHALESLVEIIHNNIVCTSQAMVLTPRGPTRALQSGLTLFNSTLQRGPPAETFGVLAKICELVSLEPLVHLVACTLRPVPNVALAEQ
jgi:hypothetical protein